MSLNTFNMVESPQRRITKYNFETQIGILKLVNWWGIEGDDRRKTYLIESMSNDHRYDVLELENFESLTLRQVIGRLKKRYNAEVLEEKNIIKGKELESKELGFWLLSIEQNYEESLLEYWKRILGTTKRLTFEGKKTLIIGTCLKSLKQHIDWQFAKDEESLTLILYEADNKRIKKQRISEWKRNEKIKLRKEIENEQKMKKLEEEIKNKNIKDIEENINTNEETVKSKNRRRKDDRKNKRENTIITKKTENIQLKIKQNNLNDKNNQNNKNNLNDKNNQSNQTENIISNNNTKNKNLEVVELNEEFICEKYKEITDLEITNEGYQGEECIIKTEPNKIVCAEPCNLKKGVQEAVNKTIKEMLDKGYISESNSIWNNLVRPVVKPDNSIRLCVNLMALNEIVEQDNHPIPDLENIIDMMQGNKYFSVIDLKEGYFQIRLREQDRHKTAFTVNQKKYEFNRMPMGYKNSPAIFQRIMEKELREFINNGCAVYLDDIVVYGKTVEEHDEILFKVLNKLNEVRLKINPNKLQLRQKRIKLLGLLVDGNEIEMPEEMREKILEFKIPKTKKELQRFLGAITYHRRFIDDIGKKTELLYEILKNDKTMNDWGDDHTRAFRTLQEEANKKIVRYHPDYTKDFILETDASNTGVGAILYQLDELGQKRIIKPIASKLKSSEVHWGITEKEMYAIVWATEKLEM